MSCRLANEPQVRTLPIGRSKVILVAGEGFEPSKAEPGDLQNPQGGGFRLRIATSDPLKQ